MENMNNQGKTNKQYQDSAKFAWYGVVGMIILLIFLPYWVPSNENKAL